MSSTFTNLLYHIVYSTKYRQPLIAPAWQESLHKYIGGIVRERDGIAIEIGGMPDHVHVLAKLSPKRAVMDVLRDIKSGSSKWVNDTGHVRGRFEWQTGYGTFSVSHSQVDRVVEYIQTQAEHHRSTTFQDEFLAILRRHEIEIDMRYVFEEEIVS